MSDTALPRWICLGAIASFVATAVPASLSAAEAPAPVVPQRLADAPTLKHLPGSHDLLTFRGESSAASWPVYLNRNEAAQVTMFQMGLLNTVSLLPERSVIRLSVNGRPLATMQIKSPDKMAMIPVRIPAGVLVPGFNEVQATVTMAHRVDCSVKATYELWTLLDPAQTGFVVPRQTAFGGKSVEDLAGEPLGEDGTSRIHLRLPEDADAATLGRAADLVGALSARAHLLRPVVDVGAAPGAGPGFDIAFSDEADNSSGSREVGREAGLTLKRDTASNRLTVVADTSDPTQFDATLAALRRADERGADGTPQGLRALTTASGFPVEEGRRLTFADVGLRSESFTGRHLMKTLGLTLPKDFYPGSYGTVRVYVDGERAAGLSPGSSLVFRVNGTLVSSLPLGPGSPDRMDHAMVDLPLQFFRPGYNAIDIEGNAITAADEQCTLSTAPAEPRLTIADTSEIVLPHLARMQTAPQIAATLRADPDAQAPGLDLYFAGVDPAALGVGMTLAANVAARDGSAGHVRINLDQPVTTDRPGIVIGALAGLPESLGRQLRLRTVSGDTAAPSAATADTAAVASTGDVQKPLSGKPFNPVQTAIDGGAQWLRNKGFFFSPVGGNDATLAVNDHSLVVADVAMSEARRTMAGVDLPRFVAKPDRWLVMTGSSTDAMASATQALVANDRWKDLAGETVAYDPTANQISRIEPTRFSYVIPKTVAINDVQPILGGIVSNNIVASVTVLAVLLSLLGLSTHALLRFLGVRPR